MMTVAFVACFLLTLGIAIESAIVPRHLNEQRRFWLRGLHPEIVQESKGGSDKLKDEILKNVARNLLKRQQDVSKVIEGAISKEPLSDKRVFPWARRQIIEQNTLLRSNPNKARFSLKDIPTPLVLRNLNRQFPMRGKNILSKHVHSDIPLVLRGNARKIQSRKGLFPFARSQLNKDKKLFTSKMGEAQANNLNSKPKVFPRTTRNDNGSTLPSLASVENKQETSPVSEALKAAIKDAVLSFISADKSKQKDDETQELVKLSPTTESRANKPDLMPRKKGSVGKIISENFKTLRRYFSSAVELGRRKKDEKETKRDISEDIKSKSEIISTSTVTDLKNKDKRDKEQLNKPVALSVNEAVESKPTILKNNTTKAKENNNKKKTTNTDKGKSLLELHVKQINTEKSKSTDVNKRNESGTKIIPKPLKEFTLVTSGKTRIPLQDTASQSLKAAVGTKDFPKPSQNQNVIKDGKINRTKKDGQQKSTIKLSYLKDSVAESLKPFLESVRKVKAPGSSKRLSNSATTIRSDSNKRKVALQKIETTVHMTRDERHCPRNCHENATCIQGKCKCRSGYWGDGVRSCLKVLARYKMNRGDVQMLTRRRLGTMIFV